MSMPRKVRCCVDAITDHGGRVYTLELVPAAPLPSFRPGQFLHLTVEPYDPSGFWPESRVFSIASSSRERNRLRLCYAVKGRYTTRMEQALKPGSEVWVKLPYGDFVIDGARDSVLIAGGTGMSAFTAFLEALDTATPGRFWLVYGARSPDLFLFTDLLRSQFERVPGLDLIFFSESGAATFPWRLTTRPNLSPCLAGRVDLDELWARIPAPAAKVFYLSGPPVMLKTLGEGLSSRGVPPAMIRTDAWE